VWGEMDKGNGQLRSYQVLSAFVSCSQQGRLPGCRYEFDDEDSQCIDGREGVCVLINVGIICDWLQVDCVGHVLKDMVSHLTCSLVGRSVLQE